MDLDVLPNAQCTQFHGKWAEKDRNFGVTLMIEPVFMRATREGVKINVVMTGLGMSSELCMIGYSLVLAMNYLPGMAVITLNVIGDAATNVIVNFKEGVLDKEKYNKVEK